LISRFPLEEALLKTEGLSSDFFVFAHGKPGALLINGKWLSGNRLVQWFRSQPQITGKAIRIYGCEFGRGNIGKLAVTQLSYLLKVPVSASDDITGLDGDWELEVGTPYKELSVESYKGNLQCTYLVGANGVPSGNDYDGDGVANTCDLDDDNDGILDLVENPYPCFASTANYSFTGTLSGARNRATGTAITRDFIFGNNFGFKLDFLRSDPVMATNYLADVAITIEVTVGDESGSSLGSISVNGGAAQSVTLGAGVNQTYSFTPSPTSSYTIQFTGSGGGIIPVNAIVIKRTINNAVMASFDFGLSTSSNIASGYTGVETASSATTPYPTGSVTVGCAGNTDTDFDGLSNDIDIDSDGDGCPDALEGDYGFLWSNLNGSMRLNSPVDASGSPTISGAPQGIGTSKLAGTQSTECNTCSSGSSLFTDIDGDGVGDDCDLDNDNDGIVDTNEGSYKDVTYTPSSATAGSTTVGGTNLNVAFSTVGGGWRNSPSGSNFVYFETSEAALGATYTFTFNPVVDDVSLFVNNLNWISKDGRTVIGNFTVVRQDNTVQSNLDFNIRNSEHNLLKVEYTYGGNTYHAVQGNILGGNAQGGGLLDFVDFTNATNNGIKSLTFTLLSNNSGTNLVAFAYPVIDYNIDTDGDGIPNYLDKDSDNDGCPDAIEGAGSFDAYDINASQSLKGDVDANGVPTITSSATGQASHSNVTTASVKDAACISLPVSFGKLGASINANGVLTVNWESLLETNNDHFEVEASTNGIDFVKIGTVASKAADGNSTGTINYMVSTTLENSGLALGLSSFMLLGFGLMAFKKLRKWMVVAAVVSGITMLGIGCNKATEELSIQPNTKIYVRVSHVDKDGNKEYSAIVQAIQK
ncbi:MAG: DUF4347 domain-containing protein, partial [Niabella sp.]